MLRLNGQLSSVCEKSQLRNGRVSSEGAEREGGSRASPTRCRRNPGQEGARGRGKAQAPTLHAPAVSKGARAGPLTSNPFTLTLFILMMKHGFPSSKPKLGSTRPEQFCSMSVVNLQENLVWLGAPKLSWVNTFLEVQLMLSSWAAGE